MLCKRPVGINRNWRSRRRVGPWRVAAALGALPGATESESVSVVRRARWTKRPRRLASVGPHESQGVTPKPGQGPTTRPGPAPSHERGPGREDDTALGGGDNLDVDGGHDTVVERDLHLVVTERLDGLCDVDATLVDHRARTDRVRDLRGRDRAEETTGFAGLRATRRPGSTAGSRERRGPLRRKRRRGRAAPYASRPRTFRHQRTTASRGDEARGSWRRNRP